MEGTFAQFAAVFTLITTASSLLVAVLYVLPRDVRARRENPEGVRRVFASYQLLIGCLATACLAAFFFTAIVLPSLPDNDQRALIARCLILLAVVCLSVQVFSNPVARHRIRAEREKEAELKAVAVDTNERVKNIQERMPGEETP